MYYKFRRDWSYSTSCVVEADSLEEAIRLQEDAERIDRTTCKLYIENKITSVDNETILVDTYHKNIIHTTK